MLYEEAVARQANVLAHPEAIRIKAEQRGKSLERIFETQIHASSFAMPRNRCNWKSAPNEMRQNLQN